MVLDACYLRTTVPWPSIMDLCLGMAHLSNDAFKSIMYVKFYVLIVSRLIVCRLTFFANAPFQLVLYTEEIILKAKQIRDLLFLICYNFMLKLFTVMHAAGSYQRLMMISYLDEEILVSTFLFGSDLSIIYLVCWI